MAGRPKSGITADTDVNLDFLTKEEREALLSKKMDMIRQRNRMITERHEMIEADRRKAEESGNAVKALDSKTLPAEGVPNKPRGRGRGQGAHRDSNRPMKDRPKSHGDAFSYEPIVDVSDLSGQRNERTDNRNKGKGQHHMDRDGGQTSTPKNRRKPQPKDEGYSAGYARSNRRSDLPQDRSDRSDRSSSKPYEGRLKGDGGPPPDPTFNPLVDRRRGGGGGGGGNQDKKETSDYKRHPRNYGGGADLTKVKDTMRTMREKERERPTSNKPLDIVMTGRERRNHEQWKQERERYDNERIQRQMGDGGHWKREWDHDKVVLEYDDSQYSKMEPAKRPVGRIGSGRFDRGDRDDRPRAPNKEGKGGGSQQHQPTQAGPPNHHHPPQHQQPPPPPQHSPQSPQPSPQHGESKNPRGKGRGRGRGRGRGTSQGGAPGDKSPRPRTWSGGDDRFVECQKEMLVVKFENTAGDNTVEVEYDNEAPLSPTTSSKSSGSMPGRGPTGRTPNQGSGAARPKGNKSPNHKHDKFPKGKAGSGRIASHHQHHDPRVHQDQFVDADLDNSNHHRHSYDGSKVRTSSHSQSHGDSEEWEDCTESSGAPEDDDHLRLDCQLNPEAPEFLPTSPDFLKTPPGHVKVLNWAGSNSPLSPQSNLSQPSFSPRSPPQQQEPGSDQSSFSSPGSSSSVRAKNRREEIDTMPEPDEPLPPPFLLEAEMSGHAGMGAGNVERVSNGGDADNEEEEDDDDDQNDRFDYSIEEVVTEDKAKEDIQDAVEPQPKDDTSSSQTDNLEESSLKSVSNGDTHDTEPQPISNGHSMEEDIPSSQPAKESQETLEEAEAAASTNPKSGELSETAVTVSESVMPESDLKDVEKASSDQGTSDETNPTEDGPDPFLKTDPDPDTKSDADQISSTDNSGPDNKDPQPTAENSNEL